MNWVLIAVIGIIALYTYIGWRKGMISVVLSLVAIIATVLLTMALTPVVSKSLKENTDLYTKLRTATYNNIDKNNLLDKSFEDMGPTAELAEASQTSDEILAMAKEAINKLNLPVSIKEKMQSNTESATENITNAVNESVTSVREAIMNCVAEQLATIIFDIIIYVVIFAIIYIVMQIFMKTANIISRLPIIYQVNKIAGIVLGAAKGLIIIWVFFSVITVLSGTEFAQTVFAQINSNAFLTYLYDNNLIMKLLFSVL